jgi:hypothetical protein
MKGGLDDMTGAYDKDGVSTPMEIGEQECFSGQQNHFTMLYCLHEISTQSYTTT